MTPTWQSAEPPKHPPIRWRDWPRIALRAGLLILLVTVGLVVLLLIRVIERPLWGLSRPVTPYLTQIVCRIALRVIGLSVHLTGKPMIEHGAVVANHTSWLDIFVLNASKQIYFVSKSEVARWPGIGWLARATGTLFIERNPARAKEQTQMFQDRLKAGHKLLFFPEGTSTDGLQVLPFKTTLFQAFFTSDMPRDIMVQPLSVVYHAPKGAEPRFYGWWGDMSFEGHLIITLAAARQGSVDVIYHPPLRVADHANRKALALACERAVRDGHETVTQAMPR